MNNYENPEIPQMDAVQSQDTDDLRAYIESVNIAENIDEDKLKDIASQVSDGFEYDLRSRTDWEKNLETWTNLALQVKENKTFPWVGASNVKYPLLSIASMQFNARAYPSLIPASGDIVKCEVIGKDPIGAKLEQAKRVSKYMSYQLLNEMSNWEEDMDKLLIMLPIVGTLFKKTYYNSVLKQNVSELVLPKNIVVNYWAKSLETAERVSEVIYLNKRQIKERQMSGLYIDVDLGDPQVNVPKGVTTAILQDATLPYEIIEQHTYYDMDGDDYAEPYIITFERHTKTVLRIVARYDDTTMHISEDGKLQKIEPIQYYTKFSFIPNPDGGFYDIGFGLLLGPINESVNTLINQLIDAGTLNNLQGGFLGKGLKLKMGESQWSPGEWKSVQTASDDLRKQIIPLPTKEPSNVLFELMGTLITSGKELASVAEIFVGKMPGQNTPATTTMATIEQGMKVFTAVYKRIYRALKEEYKKLYKLNSIYFDGERYELVMDIPMMADDFDQKSYNICPNADPSTPTSTEKLMKAQALLELLPMVPGMLNPVEVISRVIEAQEQPSPEKLFSPEVLQSGQYQPPPDPKMMEMQMKSQFEQMKNQMKIESDQQKMELDKRDKVMQMMMREQEHAQEMENKRQMALVDGQVAVHNQRIFSAAEQMKNAQTMQQNDAKHQQTMQQTKEKQQLAKQQTKNSSKSGKSTQ
jgi:chaperonin GroES